MYYILAKDEEQINLARVQMQNLLLTLALTAVLFMMPVWISLALPEEVIDPIREIYRRLFTD